jgi:ribosome biogenesis GTPase
VSNLGAWGWTAREEALFQPHAQVGRLPGRVLAEHRGSYAVVTDRGELDAVVSGRFRYDAANMEEYPAVGDWVAVEPSGGGGPSVVHQVLPRATRFARPARGGVVDAQVVAANVDVVLLVTGLDHDFNVRRIERYLALAWSSGAEPVIVLNKADVCDDVAGRIADATLVAPGVPVRVISALEGDGLDSLTPLLQPGRTVALLGSSGVGKSTIVNALLGYERQATGAVRADDQRGRHTTTSRELLLMPTGALLIDSPGMRSVGMWEIEPGLADAFADIDAIAADCRFSDCTHESEPGCAVLRAIDDGSLPRARFESRRKLERESAALAARVDPVARAAHRKHWTAISKSVRVHMRHKYGAEG